MPFLDRLSLFSASGTKRKWKISHQSLYSDFGTSSSDLLERKLLQRHVSVLFTVLQHYLAHLGLWSLELILF